MSGFSARIAKGAAFENEVEDYLKYSAISVARNGTEHTHHDFVAGVRQMNDRGSKFVRFAPDGVALLQATGVIHWEAKHALNIEKDAYETYLKYADMGCNVRLFVKNPRTARVYCAAIEKVCFIPSDTVVASFPVHKRHPIDSEDWMHPRSGNGHRSIAASGTPYKALDFMALTEIPGFYGVINKVRNAV